MAIVFLLLFPVMVKIVEKMPGCYIVGMVESTLMAAHAVHTVKYYAMPSPPQQHCPDRAAANYSQTRQPHQN